MLRALYGILAHDFDWTGKLPWWPADRLFWTAAAFPYGSRQLCLLGHQVQRQLGLVEGHRPVKVEVAKQVVRAELERADPGEGLVGAEQTVHHRNPFTGRSIRCPISSGCALGICLAIRLSNAEKSQEITSIHEKGPQLAIVDDRQGAWT